MRHPRKEPLAKTKDRLQKNLDGTIVAEDSEVEEVAEEVDAAAEGLVEDIVAVAVAAVEEADAPNNIASDGTVQQHN